MLQWGLYILTVLAFLRPHEFLPGLEGVPIVKLTILVCLAMWLAAPKPAAALRTGYWALGFVIAAALSLVANGWLGGVVAVIEGLLPSVLMFLLASSSLVTIPRFRKYLWLLGWISALLVLHGWQQRQTGVGWTGMNMIQDTRIRYIGILSDPNDLGLLFAVTIVGCGYLLWTARGTLERVASLALMAWIAYGIVLTESRGTLLACLAVVGLVVWREKGTVALLAMGAAAVPVLWATTRLSTISTDEDSAEGRIETWYEGLQLFLDSPILGVGIGNFTDYHSLTAHNSIVLVAAETGVIGYTLWLGFILQAVKIALGLVGRSSRIVPGQSIASSEQRADVAILLICVAFAVCAFFLSQSYKPPLFLVVGMVVARLEQARQSEQGALEPEPRAGFGFAVKWSLLTLFGMWLLTRVLLFL